jgi:hypothetical protein
VGEIVEFPRRAPRVGVTGAHWDVPGDDTLHVTWTGGALFLTDDTDPYTGPMRINHPTASGLYDTFETAAAAVRNYFDFLTDPPPPGLRALPDL